MNSFTCGTSSNLQDFKIGFFHHLVPKQSRFGLSYQHLQHEKHFLLSLFVDCNTHPKTCCSGIVRSSYHVVQFIDVGTDLSSQ